MTQRIKVLSFFIVFSFCISSALQAQEGYEIEIQIDNYQDSNIIIGYYYGEKTLIKDTVSRSDNDVFVFTGIDTLLPGVYLFLTQPNNEYVQFMVNEQDQHFKFLQEYLPSQ